MQAVVRYDALPHGVPLSKNIESRSAGVGELGLSVRLQLQNCCRAGINLHRSIAAETHQRHASIYRWKKKPCAEGISGHR